MKICLQCKKEMEDTASVCPICGSPDVWWDASNGARDKQRVKQTVLFFSLLAVGLLMLVAGFVFMSIRNSESLGAALLLTSIVGIIITLVWFKKASDNAKSTAPKNSVLPIIPNDSTDPAAADFPKAVASVEPDAAAAIGDASVENERDAAGLEREAASAADEEIGGVYEDKLTLTEICEEYRSGAFDIAAVRRTLSCMASGRLVLIKGDKVGSAEAFASAFSDFISNITTTVDAAASRGADSSITDNAEYLQFAENSSKARNGISVCVVNNADATDMRGFLGKLMPFFRHPKKELRVDVGSAEFVHPKNAWYFAVVSEGAAAVPIDASIRAESASVTAPPKKTPTGEETRHEKISVSYSYLIELFDTAKVDFFAPEELWRKLDAFDAYISEKAGVNIGNRMIRCIEDYASVYMACGGEAAQGLDSVLADKLPMLILSGGAARHSEIAAEFDRIFGADDFPQTAKALRANIAENFRTEG